MNHPVSPLTLRPAEPPDSRPPRARPPAVARIAGWSTRHRKTAVLGWLLLVLATVLLSSLIGSGNVNGNDPGEAGRAEQVLDRPA